MSPTARAFLIAALIALPCSAALSLLFALGAGAAWGAMIHLTLFGWITGMICAVNYHTMPMFAARDFPLAWLGWAHFGAWAGGVALAALSMLLGWPAGVVLGLLAQLAGALLFAANVVLLFRRGRPRAHKPPVPPIPGQPQVDKAGTAATRGAGMALPLALLLLLLQRLGWIAGVWMLAAEHLATLGWLMLMVAGVAYHVLPRFSGAGTRGPVWARAQLGCHYAALALIVAGLGFSWPRMFAAGGLLMALALALLAWALFPALGNPRGQAPTARRSL